MSLSEALNRLRNAVDHQDQANATPSPPATAGMLRAANQEVDDAARAVLAARAEGVAALQQAGEPVAWQRRSMSPGQDWRPWKHSDPRQTAYILKHGHLEGFPQDRAEVRPVYASPLPQQTALVEEKGLGPHEPAACGASAPSEAPSDGGEG